MEFLEHHPRRRRRRRSRKRARYSAIVVAVVAFLGVSAYGLVHFARSLAELPPIVWRKPWGGIERYEPAPDYRAARTVYPYSVVPGGVLSEAELEASMAKDPVVAQHYRDILAERLHLTRLNTPMNVYASYRSANSVHWTTHTIRVPKGELILSDGTNLIRARCGNRLVFAPPPEPPKTGGPPAIEPPELVFDYAPPPIFTPPEMPAPPHPDSAPPRVAHFWPPAMPPPTWCCGPGGYPGNGRQPRPPRPSAVTEPTTMLLLGSGIFVMMIRIARRPGR
jgi:hypothetical protein